MTDNELTARRLQTGQADAAARAMKAWSARVAGSTWAEVASLAGFTDESNAIRAVRAYFGSLPQLQREDQRELWRARHEELWRIALNDSKSGRTGALRAAVAVAQRAATLDGLDAPTRVHITPSSEEMERVVAAMLGNSTPEAIEGDIWDGEEVE